MNMKPEIQMNTLLTLMSQEHSIKIYIPGVGQKDNWYRIPSERLDQFDEVTVVYEGPQSKYVLSVDIIQEVLCALVGVFKGTLKNKLNLPKNIKKGDFGKIFNNDTYTEDDDTETREREDIFSKYWLFSRHKIQTWIYSYKDEVYIEISPSYEWLFTEPPKDKNYISFDEFMISYKPHVLFYIDKKTILEWKEKCLELIKRTHDLSWLKL